MTSTTDRSRQATEEQLRQLTVHIEQGARGPLLAEHLIAAAAQVLRLNELELMAAEHAATHHRHIIRDAWAESRAARVTITDALQPLCHQATLRRLHAEEHIDIRSAA